MRRVNSEGTLRRQASNARRLAMSDSRRRGRSTSSFPFSRELERTSVPVAAVVPPVRCNCCTREEVMAVYDLFHSLSKDGKRVVSRMDFFAGLKEQVSLDFLRLSRRSRLLDRFRQSAADITLDELLALMWPRATAEDLKQMRSWVALREASLTVTESPETDYDGVKTELGRLFKLA
mmetsp:Transcript_34050/g.90726  ORF Transcript_34050/g.90726 Transcript_34050/m.90726 type:complete len:177 (-) Transcript_34050:382-912(-)|eukprot:CAMPEP_0194521076 /NCGR_PEP_ID=MMETSP0253-20130528/55288_1 /TAXON_ID=2966 /ORGANISM="Noctiluca scintillans" /LENGTH=176 /DNA_ID=CAMNT_0039365397 /DNA_START=13 /DNA_END=543 /DNA_ORIENTATION=-